MKRASAYFTCAGYIGLSHNGSGLLYPVFTAPNINVSFTQEVGREGNITAFIPFYDHDKFKFYHSSSHQIKRLNDVSIYAFLDCSDRLREFDLVELGSLVRLSDPLVIDSSLPLLTRLSIARIGGAPQSIQLSLLKEFSKHYLKSDTVGKIIESAHNKFNYEKSKYWDSLELDDFGTGRNNYISEFSGFETEELFEWLFVNECDAQWSIALVKLMSRVIYDERMFDLIGRLISADNFSLADATRHEIAIVSRGVELYSNNNDSASNFAEAMYEHVINGSIFHLNSLISNKTIFDFIDQLERAGKIDFLPIDVYIDQLMSDTISREMAYDLIDQIESSESLRTFYPEKSAHAGLRRLEIFKSVIAEFGRLGLVVDLKRRRSIGRIPASDAD